MTTLLAQRGEDRRLVSLFDRIGTTNCVAVEFGALDGLHGSNTAHFRLALGWRVILFDVAPLSPIVIPAKVTAENINALFAEAGVPQTFDLLSIDIDGNDLWVWQALTFEPRVVVIEFNPRWGPSKSRTVPYDPDRFWDGTDYYGASVLALWRLGQRKGYDLVRATRNNLIFVQRGLQRAMRPTAVARTKKRKRPDPQWRRWEEYP